MEPRFALFLTQDDTLNVYKALSLAHFSDSRAERVVHLIEEWYEEIFGERLTEPWEWEE